MTKEDALHRVKGYLTDYLPIDCVGEIDEIIEALSTEPCEDTVSIPKDATNGDVFKMVFPSLKAKTSSASEYDMMVKFPESYAIIAKNWWNAPYKGRMKK